jgi:hypothetical protein
MVIAGLLLIALICLVVGLVLPNAAWLIASVIASAGAGYLVLRVVRAARPAAEHAGANGDATGSNGTAEAGVGSTVSGSDGAAGGEAGAQQVADSGVTIIDSSPPGGDGDVSADGGVWVIDGRPRYHLATCAIIQGQDAEPIPFEQATEDGFMPCSLCEPNAVRSVGLPAEY